MPAAPNVIIVCTDQQRTDSLACYGSDFMRTPGFDYVAERGTRFDRAYCPSAVCTPSRISLLSGQSVSRHGVWNVGVNAGDDVDLLSHQFGRAGYQTAIVGKAHFEAYGAGPHQSRESIAAHADGYGDWEGPYYGFAWARLALGHTTFGMAGHYGAWLRRQTAPETVARWQTAQPADAGREFGGNALDWDMPTHLSNAVWTADTAIEYLGTVRDPARPFFLCVSFQDPHHPHAVPRDFSDRVDPAAVPLPDYVPGEHASMPPHVTLAHHGQLKGSPFAQPWPVAGQHDGFDYRDIDEGAQRLARSYYYSLVQLVDRQLLRLWAWLDAANLLDDTVVIVTSDHGELLGDHGLWMKGPFHYEPLARVPLLVMGPGLPVGQVDDRVVSLVDVVPTVQNLVGLPVAPDAIDGVDLFASPQERSVLCETILDWQGMICRTLVTEQHKLTHYAGAEYGELFDLKADPGEHTNLWQAPQAATIRARLLGRLLDHDSRIMASPRERLAYA